MKPIRCRGCHTFLPVNGDSYCSETCRRRADARRRQVAADRARLRRAIENHPATPKERP